MTAYCSPLFLKRSRHVLVAVAFLLLILSQFSLLRLLGWENGYFFFETATPASIAEGHPRADLLRTSIADFNNVLVTRYVRWHSAQISAIKANPRGKSGLRTMIFVGNGPRHGLGDRFRGILFAYLASVFSGRALLIKWDEPYPLSQIFVNGIGTNFTYDPVYFAPRLLPNGSVDEMRIANAKSLHDLPMFLSTVGTVWLESEPRAQWKEVFALSEQFPELETSQEVSKILGAKVKPSPHEIFPLFLRALFRPSRELRKLMSEPIAHHNRFSISRLWKTGALRKISLTDVYISVHARLGHGIGEHTERFDLHKHGLTMKSLAECMADRAMKLARDVGITDPPRFYLATDTVEFRRLFKRALLGLDSRTKTMSGTWGVTHVKNLRKDRAGDLEQYLYTFMDIYLLSKGKGVLCSRSGFCSLAVWMGGIRASRSFREAKCIEWMQGSRVS